MLSCVEALPQLWCSHMCQIPDVPVGQAGTEVFRVSVALLAQAEPSILTASAESELSV